MTPSDIIAIVAIVLSAIVSIASAYISYKSNKANITAKIDEIKFQERREAFREIVEHIAKIEFALTGLGGNINNARTDLMIKELSDSAENMFLVYQRNRMYLPKELNDKINQFFEIGVKHFSAAKAKDKDSVLKWIKELDVILDEMVSLVQNILGLNDVLKKRR